MPIGFPFGGSGTGLEYFGPLELWTYANFPYVVVAGNSPLLGPNVGALAGSRMGHGNDIGVFASGTPRVRKLNTLTNQIEWTSVLPRAPANARGNSPFRSRNGSFFSVAAATAGQPSQVMRTDSTGITTLINFPDPFLGGVLNMLYYIEETDEIIYAYRVASSANIAFSVSYDDGVTWDTKLPLIDPTGWNSASPPTAVWKNSAGHYFAIEGGSGTLWASQFPNQGWVILQPNWVPSNVIQQGPLAIQELDLFLGSPDTNARQFFRCSLSDPVGTIQQLPRSSFPDANWPSSDRYYHSPIYHPKSGRLAAFANGLFPMYSVDAGVTWNMGTVSIGLNNNILGGSTTQTYNFGRQAVSTEKGRIMFATNYNAVGQLVNIS